MSGSSSSFRPPLRLSKTSNARLWSLATSSYRTYPSGLESEAHFLFGIVARTRIRTSDMVSKAKRAALAQHSKSEIPPPIPQKDLYHRINYTLQASAFLQNLNAGKITHAGPSQSLQTTPIDRKGKGKADTRTVDFAGIARREMKSTRKMAAHTQLRLYVRATHNRVISSQS